MTEEQIGRILRELASQRKHFDRELAAQRKHFDEQLDDLREEIGSAKEWWTARAVLLEQADEKLRERDRRHSDGIAEAQDAASTGKRDISEMQKLMESHAAELVELKRHHAEEVKSERKSAGKRWAAVTGPVAIAIFEAARQTGVLDAILRVFLAGTGG